MNRILIPLICAVWCAGAIADDMTPDRILHTLEQATASFTDGDYENALTLFRQTLDNPESFRSGGLKAIDKVTINGMAGRCHIALHDYAAGLPYMLRADSIRSVYKLMFDQSAETDARMTALCYFRLGDNDKGDEWGNRYALLAQKTGGMNAQSAAAKAWLFLYRMHLGNGDPAHALIYAKKLINLSHAYHVGYEEMFENPDEMIDFLFQVYSLLYGTNDTSNALELALNLETLLEENYPGSLRHLRICNMLTTMNINTPGTARTYLDKAIVIMTSMEEAGEFNEDMMATINNMSLLMADEDPQKALALYDSFLDKCRATGHDDGVIYAVALNGYAYLKGYDSPDAPAMFSQAFHKLAELDTSDITHIFSVGFNWILSLEANVGSAYVIEDVAVEVTAVLNRRLMKAFNNLSESKRNLYWQQVAPWYQTIMPHLAYYCDTQKMWKLLYDCLLETRGILLNSSVSLATVIKESDDPELQAIYAQYSSIKGNVNLSDALETRLLAESRKYNDFLAPFQVDSDKVHSMLGKDEVTIEFLRYDANALRNMMGGDGTYREPDVRYLALVLDSSSPVPQAVELCRESDLHDGSLHNLYDCVWRPVIPWLNYATRIYFSPDGALFSLPVEYARTPLDKYLWETYDCRRLSSTREIVNRIKANRNGDNAGMALFGGMKYDMSVREMKLDAEKYRDVTEEMARERGERGLLRHTRPLPGSLLESEQIHDIARRCLKNETVDLYKEKQATEAAFKSVSGQHRQMIHIATHGFYNGPSSDETAALGAALGGTGIADVSGNEAVEAQNKMMRHSGLLFSGVDNVRFNEPIPDDVEDGILDSYEISGLDLHGTDLVTLSACQTGLGQVSGDGVFGLQRGFKKAGVNSIMMSLWNVDDDATCLFMTEFYRNLLEHGTGATGDKHKSLRKAREAVMSRPQWKDERFWAGFILLDALR